MSNDTVKAYGLVAAGVSGVLAPTMSLGAVDSAAVSGVLAFLMVSAGSMAVGTGGMKIKNPEMDFKAAANEFYNRSKVMVFGTSLVMAFMVVSDHKVRGEGAQWDAVTELMPEIDHRTVVTPDGKTPDDICQDASAEPGTRVRVLFEGQTYKFICR